MIEQMEIHKFWSAVLAQQAEEMLPFFHEEAKIYWPNTGETFTVKEFIAANCAYPGSWEGEIQRIDPLAEGLVTAVQVRSRESGQTWHVVSFMHIIEGKVIFMEEYWGEDEEVPQWRRELRESQKEEHRQ